MSSVTTEHFYKSLFYKFFCTNLSQVVLRRFYTERFVQYDLCGSYWFNLFISYKSEKTDLIRSESYHPHFNAESCHDFASYAFRLVKSYKSFHVRHPLEILRDSSKPFSEAATGGVL